MSMKADNSLPTTAAGSLTAIERPASLRLMDLAARFRVSIKTISRHVDQGLLPPPDFHVGRFPHWLPARIEEWIITRKIA